MNPIKKFMHKLDNLRLKLILLTSIPTILFILSLIFLCTTRLSVYIYNCYIEILAIAIGWMILWGLIFILRKLKDSHPINLALVLTLVIITITLSYPSVRKVVIGRYVFYTRGMYTLSHNDVRHIKSAIEAYRNQEWKLVKSHIDSCSNSSREFFSYSTSKLYNEVEKQETAINNFSNILNNYKLTPQILELYESLAYDYGGRFQDDFVQKKEAVRLEIENIDMLFEAIESNNEDKCRELIVTHGFYWFEPAIQEEILTSCNCIQTLKEIVLKEDSGKTYKTLLTYAWRL